MDELDQQCETLREELDEAEQQNAKLREECCAAQEAKSDLEVKSISITHNISTSWVKQCFCYKTQHFFKTYTQFSEILKITWIVIDLISQISIRISCGTRFSPIFL